VNRTFRLAVDELVNHRVLGGADRLRGFHCDDFAFVEHRNFLNDAKNLRDFMGYQ